MGPILKPLSLVALAVAGWGRADDYSLKYTPKEGATVTYKMKVDMDITGNLATMDATVVQKILKVDPDGTYSVQDNTVDGKVVYSGSESAIPKNSTVHVYKPNGEVVSLTGQETDGNSLRVQRLTMLKRPDNNVKIGDTWQIESKADTAAVPPKPSLHGTFKLVGEETVGTYKTLKIEASLSEGDIPLPGNTTLTFWISKDDGSMVKSECKYVNLTFPGAPNPMTGSISMMRIDKS
jgi:hypothetical protein